MKAEYCCSWCEHVFKIQKAIVPPAVHCPVCGMEARKRMETVEIPRTRSTSIDFVLDNKKIA